MIIKDKIIGDFSISNFVIQLRPIKDKRVCRHYRTVVYIQKDRNRHLRLYRLLLNRAVGNKIVLR